MHNGVAERELTGKMPTGKMPSIGSIILKILGPLLKVDGTGNWQTHSFFRMLVTPRLLVSPSLCS